MSHGPQAGLSPSAYGYRDCIWLPPSNWLLCGWPFLSGLASNFVTYLLTAEGRTNIFRWLSGCKHYISSLPTYLGVRWTADTTQPATARFRNPFTNPFTNSATIDVGIPADEHESVNIPSEPAEEQPVPLESSQAGSRSTAEHEDRLHQGEYFVLTRGRQLTCTAASRQSRLR